MTNEIDWEHAVYSFEQALDHPLSEQAMSCLEALVSESMNVGSDRTIDAAKQLIDAFADQVPKADLIAALEQLRPDNRK